MIEIDGTGNAYILAIEEILSHDSVLVTDFYIDQPFLDDVLLKDPSYKKVKDFSINGWTYSYYERKEQ